MTTRSDIIAMGRTAVDAGMSPDFAAYLVNEICERIADGRSVDGDAYRALRTFASPALKPDTDAVARAAYRAARRDAETEV